MSNEQAQLPFDFNPTMETVVYGDCETWAEKFEAFHRANPHVLRALFSVCEAMMNAGARRWSIKGAFETLRFHAALKTRGDEYKLNNYFTAYYSRLMAAINPVYTTFFTQRSMSDDWNPATLASEWRASCSP